MNNPLRVIAVGHARIPFVDAIGRLRGTFVGRDANGAPTAETVPDLPYLRTALDHGDLRRVEDAAPTMEPALSGSPLPDLYAAAPSDAPPEDAR